MARSMRVRFIAALEARGEREVESRSGRYVTMTRREGGFYFVGESGGLRFGRAATRSIPVSDSLKQTLLKEADHGRE